MMSVRPRDWKPALHRIAIALALSVTIPAIASAQEASPSTQTESRELLLERIAQLEKRLGEVAAQAPPAHSETLVAMAAPQAAPQQTPAMPPGMVMPQTGPSPGANPANPEGNPTDSTNPQDLLDRIKLLEQRLKELETSAVLSEPETRTKRVEVYVDPQGGVHDEPVPGARKTITYQRERVYRRQTMSEQIEAAIADADQHKVEVGVNAGIVAQFGFRTQGDTAAPTNRAYELASADLFFTAGIAQNTIFFADLVGLGGTHPENEIPTLTLINGYSARLQNQNQISVREAWLRTEVIGGKLAMVAGRMDLTNYIDHNAAANDETSQFLSDALVNNPMLGLTENGIGFVSVYDPKHGFNGKFGFQQSNSNAASLNESLFTMAEVGYVARLPKTGEGNYRFWYRTDNASGTGYRYGFGTSIDQRLSPRLTLFGRYGEAEAIVKTNSFYSGGLKFDNGFGFFPGDVWGLGSAQTQLQTSEKERVIEGFYNLSLTEKLKLSFHLSHFLEMQQGGTKLGYLFPGVRLQANF
jgi:hypothetical protein